ncbi:MAG: acetate--CoA ligase family protein [Candidatus Anstonellales archaeon]
MRSLAFLERAGFHVSPYKIVKSFDDAVGYANKIGYPVVMKLSSEEHKTDIGGVILDIYTDKMLGAAWHYFENKFKGREVMVQKQIKEGIELYAGIKYDDSFGTILLFGLGGIYIEIFKEIETRLCPINKEEAEEMINELKVGKLLNKRGKTFNKDALINFLVKLSKIAVEKNIKEMDINPFKLEKECIIIDARLIK